MASPILRAAVLLGRSNGELPGPTLNPIEWPVVLLGSNGELPGPTLNPVESDLLFCWVVVMGNYQGLF
jgi:hypothetical protein